MSLYVLRTENYPDEAKVAHNEISMSGSSESHRQDHVKEEQTRPPECENWLNEGDEYSKEEKKPASWVTLTNPSPTSCREGDHM